MTALKMTVGTECMGKREIAYGEIICRGYKATSLPGRLPSVEEGLRDLKLMGETGICRLDVLVSLFLFHLETLSH